MSRRFSILVACALLLGGGAAAQAEEYIWNGASNCSWTDDNWETVFSDPINWPGELQAGDDAITSDPTNNPVNLAAPLNYPLNTVRVAPDNEYEFLTLVIAPGGAMETTGLVTIKGDQSVPPASTAKLVVKSAAFNPYSLRLWGGASASQAYAEFEVGFAIDDLLCIRNLADITIWPGKEVSAATLAIGNQLEDFFGYLTLTGGGTIKVGTLVMEGDRSTSSNGTLYIPPGGFGRVKTE